jgi:hypothetical protein
MRLLNYHFLRAKGHAWMPLKGLLLLLLGACYVL